MSLYHEGEQSVHANEMGEDEAPSSRGSKKWIGAAAAVAVVASVSVGGMALVNALGGGGAQPEDVLPANAIAFAKLDLDPSAGQKLAAYQLTSKFPKVKAKVTSQDTSIKESIFGSFFTGPTGETGFALDFKKDVEPWLGDRIGVGVFPDIDGDKQPEVGVAIAYTDQTAAKVALDKAIAHEAKSPSLPSLQDGKSTKTGYAFADGFVIVSDTTAHATALVKAGQTNALATSTYAEDVKTLNGDQIAVAWADIAAVYKAIPKGNAELGGLFPGLGASLQGANDPAKVSGRFVTGLHADPSFLEVSGKAIAFKGADPLVKADAGAQAGMIESFPADVFGALTATGLGHGVGAMYTTLTASGDQLGIAPALHDYGIDSAKQIETLLGIETGVIVGGTVDQPDFAVRTQSADPDGAFELARRVVGAAQLDTGGVTVQKIEGPKGIVVGMGAGLTSAIFDKSGSKLGSTESFKQVVPNANTSDFTAYINLAKLMPLLTQDSPKDAASLKPLNAAGLTVSSGSAATFRFRVSFR